MATTYTVTHDFTVDTFAVADQVDTNFSDILTAINALDAGNLASGTVALARISGLTSTQCAATFFLDEDDMASDSATAVSSQQALKAHVAAQILALVPLNMRVRGWVNFSVGAAPTYTITINDHYNVSGVTREASGHYRVSWSTDFANTNYTAPATVFKDTGGLHLNGFAKAVGYTDYKVWNTTGVIFDATVSIDVIAMGDQ